MATFFTPINLGNWGIRDPFDPLYIHPYVQFDGIIERPALYVAPYQNLVDDISDGNFSIDKIISVAGGKRGRIKRALKKAGKFFGKIYNKAKSGDLVRQVSDFADKAQDTIRTISNVGSELASTGKQAFGDLKRTATESANALKGAFGNGLSDTAWGYGATPYGYG
ncbi:hypothetical protein ADUPG1_010930, partial [Aduncisulcus paluster]